MGTFLHQQNAMYLRELYSRGAKKTIGQLSIGPLLTQYTQNLSPEWDAITGDGYGQEVIQNLP